MAVTPGPNMLYLINRSIMQGKSAGLISLAGVLCGFLFHITLVAFGLTAILLAVPFLFAGLKICGALYLLYMAWQAVKPGSKGVFAVNKNMRPDRPLKLFIMGLLTNVLNPKMAIFYLSLFPIFIKTGSDNLIWQCYQLGILQMLMSALINLIMILLAARAVKWFGNNPFWVSFQKWLTASILTLFAGKMLMAKLK